MIKSLLFAALLLTSTTIFAQRPNRTYKLYYIDSLAGAFLETDIYLRNDTLFVGLASPANILDIRTEDKKITYNIVALRPLREAVKGKKPIRLKRP